VKLVQLSYKEVGDHTLPLMVFIHGGGVGGWMWDKQVVYFSRNFHCIVPELLGHGNNNDGLDFSIELAAKKVNKLIEEKGEGKEIHVIGFSLGAQVLIAMLSMKPNLIDYAVINSALVKPVPFAKTLVQSMMLFFPLVKNKSFSRFQAKSMYITNDYFNRYYTESCQINKETFYQVMTENMSFAIPRGFKNVRAKLLVTVGENERKIMKDSAKEIATCHSNCTGVIIPGVGHGFSLANPKEFNKMVEMWVKQEFISNRFKQVE